MINANELRVGNWVNDEFYGDFEIVGFINFKDGNQSAYKSLEYYPQSQDTDKLNSIPLTEEWLLKFGFTNIKSDHPSHRQIVVSNKGELDERTFNIQFLGNRALYSDTFIAYVHQLQNLYFALTGEELTIKEL
jgi:hypothetical protein